jgi:hypothetical protein
MATIAPADSKIGQQIARITNAKRALADYLKDNTDLATENMSINELVEAILALIGQKGAYNIVQNLLDDGNSELVITDASGSNANELDSLITREISGAYTNDRVTQIGEYAFANCTEITDINLPNVINISYNSFRGCTKLKAISLPHCQVAGGSSFYGCSNLEAVSLPSCHTLGSGALGSAFWGCSKLSQVSLPLVTTIMSFTFRDTVIQKIDFLSVNNIESSAFIYARQLDTLILRNSNVCILENINAFNSTKIAAGTGYIYVPDNLVDSYKIATNWVTFANQIKPISELEGS